MVLIMQRWRRLAYVLLPLTLVVAACGGSSGSDDSKPKVVVTYPVLGAVVRELVGSQASVTVLMPNGADPHEWSPSAKDIDKMLDATIVIDNGLGLEANLQDPLQQASGKGVKVFTVAEHITVRTVKEGEGAEPDDPDQAPGAEDPHLWMDPLTMKEWVGPLAAELSAAGLDVSANTTKVLAELDKLHADVSAIVAKVPAQQRKLVTGHESMGYFAQRYEFTLIGAVVPSITSQAEASAGELAELGDKIKDAQVTAIFTETGTPAATVKAIADDSGARVVELSTHTLPKDGTYRTFLLDIASTVSDNLNPK